jgi:hypothetical protein
MEKKLIKASDLHHLPHKEVLVRQVIAACLSDVPKAQQQKDFGLTRGALEAIIDSDQFKSIMEQVGKESLAVEVAQMKDRLSRMGLKASKVYEKVMDDYLDRDKGARDAVVVAQSVHRSLGVDQDDNKQQDANINIILPGEQPKTVVVEADIEETD